MRRKFKPKHKGVVVRPSDTPENRAKLASYVDRINSRMSVAYEMAKDVSDLKTTRLYLLTHKSWEEFVDDAFEFNRQWADELIAAYDGKHYLESDVNLGNKPLLSSGQVPTLTTVRELAAVGRIAQKKGVNVNAVLTKAAEGGKVTPKSIKEAHHEIERAKKQRKTEKQEASPIPEKIVKAIAAGNAVRQIVKDVRALCKRLDGFAATAFAVHLSAGQHTDIIRRSLEPFKFAAPYADCVHCGGGPNCKRCDSTGWLRKVDFDKAPAALRSTSRIVDVESVETDEEGVEI